MPKGVYERKARGNNREQILLTARSIYHINGLMDTTFEQIAAGAGVSPSLVSEYFGGKAELVKAIAAWTLEEHLEAIRKIDALPGLTLRQREWILHSLMAQNLEDWRLILRSFLVPALGIGDREALRQANYRTVLDHLDELREPTEESAVAFANGSCALHMGYLLDDREEPFGEACRRHLAHYLR